MGCFAAGSADAAALVALIREAPRACAGSISEVEAAGGPRPALDRVCGLFADAAEERAAGDIDAWAQEGIATIGLDDPWFPSRLRCVPQAPALLFVRGVLSEADADGVAVIGTRRPTAAGLELARDVAEVLVGEGRTVISGLATGIDTAAHQGALRAGGRTLAVLGNGLHHAYPPANAGLQRRLSAVISQFLPDQAPTRETFPARNAVMSGISAASVIIEAGPRSGVRIQARHALSQGRPLFLMRWLLDQAWARDLAARPGVSVFDGAADLASELASWKG